MSSKRTVCCILCYVVLLLLPCKQCCAVQCSFRLTPLMLCIALVINPRHACAARVTVLGSCVCVSVRSISATTSKSKPRKQYQRFIATRQKRIKLAIFLKMLRSKVMASFAHFVGVRRSCRALQFILTATEAAIATLTVS